MRGGSSAPNLYNCSGPEKSVAGWLCTCSGWVKHSEPHCTPSPHSTTEKARSLMFGYTGSGWFNRTEPPLPPALLRHHGMECDYASVWTQRTSSNLLKTHAFRVSKVCRVLIQKCGAVREHPTSLPAAIIPNHPELL